MRADVARPARDENFHNHLYFCSFLDF